VAAGVVAAESKDIAPASGRGSGLEAAGRAGFRNGDPSLTNGQGYVAVVSFRRGGAGTFEPMRKGIPVSPGVAVGKAYCLHEVFVRPEAKRLEDNEVSAELARYEVCRDRAAGELRELQQKIEKEVGHREASIFSAQESILYDNAFSKQIRQWIVDERMTAPAALDRLVNHYAEVFANAKDEFLRERVSDLRDVARRLADHIAKKPKRRGPEMEGPLIVVADEILPSQLAGWDAAPIAGIVTQRGSQTGHAAIIARSRGIPCVSGVQGILQQVKTGDTLVVDGREGRVVINTDVESLAAYRKLEREFVDLRDHLAENRDQPAVTADGTPLELLANVNGVSDAKAAVKMGAGGVGLYRTEYLFLTHPDAPDEDEQRAAYRELILAAPPGQVTIRTLDIGGDKTVPYFGLTQREANPFMGFRSIRLSFAHREFFLTQLRAILRAAGETADSGRDVKIMFPMITTLEEMRRARVFVRRAARQLEQRGQPFATPPLGMMLEVPAAAMTIGELLPLVDFVAIGSNDLVQYLMAADRDNPRVSHLCQPLAPAVLRILSRVIAACNEAGAPVTLCGEMAAQPQAFVALMGMGLTRFSMSPAFIPTTKELAGRLSIRQAQAITARTMQFTTTRRVKRYLDQQLGELAPEIGMMVTRLS